MLINSVKDVASALGDLIHATKSASGKSINDPAMVYLKDSAKVSCTWIVVRLFIFFTGRPLTISSIHVSSSFWIGFCNLHRAPKIKARDGWTLVWLVCCHQVLVRTGRGNLVELVYMFFLYSRSSAPSLQWLVCINDHLNDHARPNLQPVDQRVRNISKQIVFQSV